MEYLTHCEYEKAIRRANGEEERVEEYEVDDKSFAEDMKELMGEQYNPDEWEEVTDG